VLHRVVAENEAGWTLWNVGQAEGANPIGAVSYGTDGSSLTVESTAFGFSAEGDQLTWVGEARGDSSFSLVVLMTNIQGSGWQGVTIRKNLSGVSDGVFLGLNPSGELGILTRPDGEWEAGDFAADKPLWLMLKREGEWVKAYSSEDGEDWNRLGMVQVEQGETIYSGVAIAGSETSIEVSAHFDVYHHPDEAPEETSGPSGTGGNSGQSSGDSNGETSTGGRGEIPEGQDSLSAFLPPTDLASFLSRGQGPVIYVDNVQGNDDWDGKLSARKDQTSEGPKRSLGKALEAAYACQENEVRIVLKGSSSDYESVDRPVTEKNITFFATANVTIGTQEQEITNSEGQTGEN